MMDASELRRVDRIFEKNGWDKDEALISPQLNLLDAVISFIQDINQEDREIVFCLLEKYERIVDYRDHSKSLINKFKNIYDDTVDTFLIPVSPPSEGRVKSGHYLLYEFFSTASTSGFERLIDVDSVHSPRLVNISDSNVIFIDDFIGTGDQFVDEVYRPFEKRNGTPLHTYIFVIRIQQEGFDHISKLGIQIITNGTRPKAISSGYATGNLGAAAAMNIYRKIEDIVNVPNGLSLGYGQCEAIISMKRTPDNTLPIFWCILKKGQAAMARAVPPIDNTTAIMKAVLRAVRSGSSVEHLISYRITYSQVVSTISALLATGHLFESDGKLSVADKGLRLLRRRGGGEASFWLEPLDHYRIERMGVNEAYFPGHDSLEQVRDRTRS